LHITQLMPLPLTVSCFSEIQIGLPFWIPSDQGSPRQRAVKRALVCVCVCTVTNCFLILHRFLCHLCLHILVCGNICFDVQMGSCWNCKSVVPQNLAKCLTCDVLLTTDHGVLQPKQHEDPACLVCVVCRTPNSRNDRTRSCITCSASLSNATVVMLIYS